MKRNKELLEADRRTSSLKTSELLVRISKRERPPSPTRVSPLYTRNKKQQYRNKK
jgi:hypothetical protein